MSFYADVYITRSMDMLMMTLCNARERDRDDWATLFQEADKRFNMVTRTSSQSCREANQYLKDHPLLISLKDAPFPALLLSQIAVQAFCWTR